MLVFASEFAREIGRQGRATRVPLLLVLRDARHGIVTRDHLRRRDQIVAAIVVKGDARDWRTITAEESDALIAAAVASGVAARLSLIVFGSSNGSTGRAKHFFERPEPWRTKLNRPTTLF